MANYKLSKVENKRANKFIKKHEKCKPNDGVFLQFKYIFTPTGIGIRVAIKCPYCNEEMDITDVECW